jgi:hydrogenase expression/formation protein HypC
MCLGVPGRVIERDGETAIVDFFGVRRRVSLRMLDESVVPGDYVLNSVGFALRRIPSSEIGPMLALYERLIELADEDGPTPDPPSRDRAG